ncbi:GSCOCG00003882001-RA-CDS [Cotesia congregata]|uniref:Similar to NSFL1C: NSFL1 cofactor p47 (Gallus gallus) n=1 Tax=Cotesia congregata TaxID=51543 RepID=A0A8J2MPB7_COTCN|nr:GSCOCG00003882001-RA-CDS [Cotesia congregata]CAG5100000.1 Similar to NSFL1C: NSFL1 cofactor p47 (Gallus gallus) [Cotesia congregata]
MEEDLISQFMDVTSVDRERAEFYLASSAWQLEVALTNFYECGDQGPVEQEIFGGESSEQVEELIDQSRDLTAARLAQLQTGETQSGAMEPIKPKVIKPKQNSKIRTLASLQNRDSSSDEEGQAFYAGGSAHSGQQILGPNKKKEDIVSDMFKSCQDQSISGDERPQQQRPSTFSGTGYKLGQTSSDTEVIPGASSQRSPDAGVITLKLWREGFTINDGELRSYSDPQNREFMETIKRGEVPMELRQEVLGNEVRLDLEDHHHEEYVPQKPKVKAFAGRGHMLGSPSPATVGMTMPTDPSDQSANESLARSQLNVDSNNPVTTIQIRLADGQNIREQFNLTHTVGDIRRFITTMRPQYAAQDFTLSTAYPTKELTEDAKTIEEAGLKNSAIMQRLK